MGLVRVLLVLLTAFLLPAQTIITIAGMPHSHRAAVESKPALDAPLNNVYGLLLDRSGRLLVHDEALVLRLESDATLLAVAGMGRTPDGETAEGTWSSALR